MLDLDRLKKAMVALRELNKVRGVLSGKLAAVKARYEFRKSIVDTLYEYYETVADDYYAVNDGIITNPEAVEVLKDYMIEHMSLLDEQLKHARNYLAQPLKLSEVPERIEKIKSHVYYMMKEDAGKY